MEINSESHGIKIDNLDLSVSPKEDFYLYANGGWMKNNPLKADFSRFGTFDKVSETAREQLKELILNLSSDPESSKKGTIAQKVSDLFNMGMDIDRINKDGIEPILPFIERIENYESENFAEFLSWLHIGLASSFFGTGVGPDAKNSTRNIMHIGETGLGLGDRDYYLEKDENNEKILNAYEKYVKRIMELIGFDEERQKRTWETVISIETEIAKNKRTREERRDPLKSYNLMTYDELKKRYNFDWDIYFKKLGVSNLSEVNVSNPKYLDFIFSYLNTLDKEKIKDFLIFEVVSNSTGLLGDDFRDTSFELYGKVMSGKKEQRPLWKRAMAIPNSIFGEAVGELYVKKYFPKENKDYMISLVENLRKALGKHIDNLTWMANETKTKAREKLSSMTVKIGYPDKWEDYSEIEIDPAKSYLENVYNASVWFTLDNYKDLSKPVDKTEWHMYPQTVNAYYSPISNEICFPAGILQPPFFDINADDAQNYGAIGVVIGHEMTHAFDDSGRKFDKDGNLTNWWKDEDAEKFNQLADKLVEQFNKVEVAPDVFANGRFTLGENIADQGGLRIALTAYLDSMNGKESTDIDGFTPLQRFYIAYANVWANNIRDEEVLQATKMDPHSLGKNRVNETLKNLEPFYKAFGIKEGDNMYIPDSERVIIW